ncbi:MAG: alpha/beta hydrolase [Pseudomonadota bacterium]
MKTSFLISLIGALLFFLSSSTFSEQIPEGPDLDISHCDLEGDYKIIDHIVKQYNDDLVIEEVFIQELDLEIEQFSFTRLYKKDLKEFKTPIIMRPGSNMNFDSFLIGENPLAEALANEGHLVYGYNPRPGQIEFMEWFSSHHTESWGMAQNVRDMKYLADVAFCDTEKKPVYLGYSIGAIIGYAVGNAHPNAFSGMILLDGTLYSTNPEFIENFKASCEEAEDALAHSNYLESATCGVFYATKKLADLSDAAFGALYDALTNPMEGMTPGYTYVTADDPEAKTFKYSSKENLMTLVENINIFQTWAVYRDYRCEISSGERKFTNNLSEFKAPLLAVSAEHGFGDYIKEGLTIWGSDDKTYIKKIGYSHADLMCAVDQDSALNNDVLAWLRDRKF